MEQVTFALADCMLLEALGKVLEPHPDLRLLPAGVGGSALPSAAKPKQN